MIVRGQTVAEFLRYIAVHISRMTFKFLWLTRFYAIKKEHEYFARSVSTAEGLVLYLFSPQSTRSLADGVSYLLILNVM